MVRVVLLRVLLRVILVNVVFYTRFIQQIQDHVRIWDIIMVRIINIVIKQVVILVHIVI